MVMLRSSSFLKRTVWTPEIALTTVDLPWATWPMVPMLMVAWCSMTSGDRGLSSCKDMRLMPAFMVSFAVALSVIKPGSFYLLPTGVYDE